MLNNTISVSPPQKGEASDSRLAERKSLGATSKSSYKSDFEQTLTKELDQRKEDLAKKKEALPKKVELKAERHDGKKVSEKRKERDEREENESLGGTKKKVTNNDDKMISMLMASNESKVEIPDSKIENLAEIEVDIADKTKGADAKDALAQMLQKMEAQATASELNLEGIENAEATELDAAALKALLAKEAAQLQTEEQMAQMTQAEQADFNAQLEAEVGFKSEQSAGHQDLLAKLKSFEVEKAQLTDKASDFEKNVLNRLQNEQSFKINELSMSAKSQGGDSATQQDSEQLKDLKPHLLDTNQLHQAAGQSHAEFKNLVGATSASQNLSVAKLEENREANVSEIMNQAQYLVKKGGGEVNVKMNPEGLGNVHLKVIMQDGKLNVEMQTQNKDVKKLIEDSITDLKSGLAAHRISLDNVKIDTVNATNADNNTQFQSNLNHGGSEGRNRELWNDAQGNSNNQSHRKSSSSESSGLASAANRSSSVRSAQAAQAIRTYGGTKGATVNRVA